MTEEDLEELPKTGLTMRLIIEGNNYQVIGKDNEFEGSFTTLPATVETPYGTLTFTKNLAAELNVRRPKMTGDNEDEEQEDSKRQSFVITINPPMAVAC